MRLNIFNYKFNTKLFKKNNDQTPKNYLSNCSITGFLSGPLSKRSNATNILSNERHILFSTLIFTSKSKLNGLPLNGYLTLYRRESSLYENRYSFKFKLC